MVRNPAEFALNDRVNHPVYNLGTITRIDETHTIIDFDEAGRRKFVTSLLQLAHSDAAMPLKKRAVRKARKGK